jgi:hypothetical protein
MQSFDCLVSYYHFSYRNKCPPSYFVLDRWLMGADCTYFVSTRGFCSENYYSLRPLLPVLIRMYLETKMCQDISLLGQLLVAGGCNKT